MCAIEDTGRLIQAIGTRRQADRNTDLWLGARATETTLKDLSSEGVLKQYGIVAFATHGLLAMEALEAFGLAEPALVLTPPQDDNGTPDNDGLLTASEIAQLDMAADLTLLTACNTAGPSGKADAASLSGLARAFFEAGARALIVSHWHIDEGAMTYLIPKFMEFRATDQASEGEALRHAMAWLRDGTWGVIYGEPRFWAGLMFVSDGR
jgi:CHAT domain-containing protein